MNFTEKLIADQAALAAELAEMKQTLAALTAPKPKPEPAPPIDSRPVIEARDHAHDDEHHLAYLERMQRQAQDLRDRQAAEVAARREGLPEGQERDPCGLIRWIRDGKIVASGLALEKQLAKAKEHEDASLAEDLAWRRSVELPIRVNGYLPETDEDA